MVGQPLSTHVIHENVNSVLGDKYSPVASIDNVINNQGVLKVLNDAEAGNWSKIYEAGYLNEDKVEVHYFVNKKTGNVFDVKIKKQGSWSETNFTKKAKDNKITS